MGCVETDLLLWYIGGGVLGLLAVVSLVVNFIGLKKVLDKYSLNFLALSAKSDEAEDKEEECVVGATFVQKVSPAILLLIGIVVVCLMFAGVIPTG